MKAQSHTNGSTLQIVTDVDTTIIVVILLLTITILLTTVTTIRLIQCFPADDELNTCRTSLVS